MTRRKRITIVAAVIVAAAGVGVGLAESQSSTPAPVHLKLSVFWPPASVNTTCAHDDTYSLGDFLLSVPDGTPGHDTLVKLQKGACYEVNGSIWWRGAHNIVLDGDGATIKQEAVTSPGVVGGENNPALAPYCGSHAYESDEYSGPHNSVQLLTFEGGCDITFENLTVIGTHGPKGATAPEGSLADTFLTFFGTQRVLVKDVTMSGPWGDYVDASGLNEAPGGGGGYPSTDITVEDSMFSDSGRQGISVTNGCHRLTVEDNTFQGRYGVTTASLFDDETDVYYDAPIDTDLLIEHNTIEGATYDYLFAAITGTVMQRVAFEDNTLTDGAQMKIEFQLKYPTQDGNILVAGNTASAVPIGWFRPSVWIVGSEPAATLVTGNVAPAYPGHPFASIGKGLVCGDKTPSGRALDAACPSLLPSITAPTPAELPS